MKDLMIFGLRPVEEAVDAGKEIDKVLVQNNLKGDMHQQLLGKLRKQGVKIQFVPIEKLNRTTRKNHQGIIAYIAPIKYVSLEEIINDSFSEGKTPLLILLDRITDTRNFGAIARTAECVGAQGIVITEKGSASITPDAIKASAGALYNIKVCKEVNLTKSIQLIQSSGIQVIGATEKADDLIYDTDLKKPLAIVMGSEENGLSNQVMKSCDALAKLPIEGVTASLNVSVACGAFLFEAVRQRL